MRGASREPEPGPARRRRGEAAGNGAGPSLRGIPAETHEWVSFPDPDEERTWLFDVTFLESTWTCIFGRGCQGVLTGPAPELVQGCCSYGAHFTGDDDVARVEAAAATLTPEQWQYRAEAQQPPARRDADPDTKKPDTKKPDPKKGTAKRSKGVPDHTWSVTERDGDGAVTTRIVDDACIFLNRPGWPGGAGCALHRAALERRVPHLELKPDVCWQLPLRREDEAAGDGWVTSTVRQWDRRDWGEGGAEFHWWCTEAPDAFVGGRPVHEELRDELAAMVGPKVHKRLVAYLRARRHPAPSGQGVVRLPHPALRRS